MKYKRFPVRLIFEPMDIEIVEDNREAAKERAWDDDSIELDKLKIKRVSIGKGVLLTEEELHERGLDE